MLKPLKSSTSQRVSTVHRLSHIHVPCHVNRAVFPIVQLEWITCYMFIYICPPPLLNNTTVYIGVPCC